ncbi:MAG: TfoX/Sxy family protein [Acidobacteria bacterium]|nr:TfoX/Sxy family protein [Acidobacteriota bacterium]
MAYSETLAIRLRDHFSSNGVTFEEKKMMGGLCFMVDDKMCVGVMSEDLMLRTDPEIYQELIAKDGARPMDFTGRPMKGFIFVEEDALRSPAQLKYWIDLALEFNPRARSSKKKKKS